MRVKWMRKKKQKEEKQPDETRAEQEDLAEQKVFRTVILTANISRFSDFIRGMEIKEIYRLINQTLALCVPAIEQKGGTIDSFWEAGLIGFFTGETEDGLNAAILICEKIIRCGNKEAYQSFAISLCYGDVMTGVVGYKTKYTVLTLSGYTQLGSFLQQNAFRYYARILATERYISQIEGFEKKYHYRFLGVIYINALHKEEKIFDIFDGDDAEVRNKKRKTKMLFEKGVRLFLEKAFMESRAYFIEVLKADREDKAAREYVFLCDRYRNCTQKEKESVDIYFNCL